MNRRPSFRFRLPALQFARLRQQLNLSRPAPRWRFYGQLVFTGLVLVALLGSSNSELVLAAGEGMKVQLENLQAFLNATPVPGGPLTDLAGPPPVVDVKPEEAPEARAKALGLDAPKTEEGKLPPPEIMDVRKPLQWTEPLTHAGEPAAPDLLKAPPMWIDPWTGKAAEPTPTPAPYDGPEPRSDEVKPTSELPAAAHLVYLPWVNQDLDE